VIQIDAINANQLNLSAQTWTANISERMIVTSNKSKSAGADGWPPKRVLGLLLLTKRARLEAQLIDAQVCGTSGGVCAHL
jgi:hypothetical protein